MITFIIAFVVFALALLGLGLGVLLRRPPIQGSCGGLGAIRGMASDCGGVCRRPDGPAADCRRVAANQQISRKP